MWVPSDLKIFHGLNMTATSIKADPCTDGTAFTFAPKTDDQMYNNLSHIFSRRFKSIPSLFAWILGLVPTSSALYISNFPLPTFKLGTIPTVIGILND